MFLPSQRKCWPQCSPFKSWTKVRCCKQLRLLKVYLFHNDSKEQFKTIISRQHSYYILLCLSRVCCASCPVHAGIDPSHLRTPCGQSLLLNCCLCYIYLTELFANHIWWIIAKNVWADILIFELFTPFYQHLPQKLSIGPALVKRKPFVHGSDLSDPSC